MNNDRKSRGLSGATIISFVVILVVVLWMANQLQMHQQEMTYTSFVSAVQEKNVSDVYINQNSAVPTGTVSVTLKDDGNTRKVNVSDVEQVEKLLTENQVEYRLSDVPKVHVDNSCSSDADHTWWSISDLFPDEPSEWRGEFKGDELWKEPRKDEHEE